MIYFELFLHFFIIGAFTFGGGYSMLPLIQQTVLEQGWLTQQQIVDFIAVSESTPGPLAINMSTYVGARVAGLGGAFAATLGVVLPSFLIILLLSRCYKKFQKSILVKGALSGLKPAVIALIAVAVLSVAGNVFQTTKLLHIENAISLVIIIVAAFLCCRKKHPILIILTSALLGILLGTLF